MKAANSKAIPSPPSLLAAFTAGFDAIAGRIALILFPLVLDLVLWFGPRLRIKQLIQVVASQMSAMASTSSPESAEMVQANQEFLRLIGEQFNLMIALRSYPVGIPSLMASRLPSQAPLGIPSSLEIESLAGSLAIWIVLTLAGFAIGSLYFSAVSQVALSGQLRWKQLIEEWPRATLQVFLLALAWLALLIAISIPAACIITTLAFIGPSLGRFSILLYGGFMVWLIFPLLFSAHGIFVYRDNMLASFKKGVRLTRLTLPGTSLFFLIVLVLGQGLDILWRVPEESSWFALVGVAGHAFVTTGLLAASFVYYREADRWVQKLFSQWSQNQLARAKV